MSRGLAYDSDEGRATAAALTAIMTGEAYAQSAVVARDHGGPFKEYKKNEQPFLRVIKKHRAAAYAIPACACAGGIDRRGTVILGRRTRIGHAIRVPECPGDRACADRHDRFHDGLRHDRRRA